MVYFPTFTIKINHSCRYKYTIFPRIFFNKKSNMIPGASHPSSNGEDPEVPHQIGRGNTRVHSWKWHKKHLPFLPQTTIFLMVGFQLDHSTSFLFGKWVGHHETTSIFQTGSLEFQVSCWWNSTRTEIDRDFAGFSSRRSRSKETFFGGLVTAHCTC